jgi:hypothetical protein
MFMLPRFSMEAVLDDHFHPRHVHCTHRQVNADDRRQQFGDDANSPLALPLPQTSLLSR